MISTSIFLFFGDVSDFTSLGVYASFHVAAIIGASTIMYYKGAFGPMRPRILSKLECGYPMGHVIKLPRGSKKSYTLKVA